ncbi:MAG: AAA+ family ATPase [Paracoccaceae bacterium]
MKQIVSMGLALFIGVAPLQAQDTEGEIERGFSLLQEGTRMLLEGLLRELGPALLELEGRLIDLQAYHAPEILPNGDIIIRRRVPRQVPENGETDL